jgi:hypothetical protein
MLAITDVAQPLRVRTFRMTLYNARLRRFRLWFNLDNRRLLGVEW